MAVRNQPSTTSLSRFATAHVPGDDPFNGSKSRDFCNSFWGLGDAGPNVLFARMRGATKTTDEVRNFWNERSVIEEEYAARLAKLSRAPIGTDEIGELRNALDVLRDETERQAESHRRISQLIRAELEEPMAQFHVKQVSHRRTLQASLEKKFKAKQTQEAYVTKAREKYEGDCLRINSYTQQASFMQGKDLERIQMKLQRTRQTVQANEKDLQHFTKDLLDMLPDWEADWKEFCDSCQDLEEDRIEFMKDNMWNYANHISTVCVEDDMSCERIRTVLEVISPEQDVESFVNKFGTGNSIPEPVEFNPETAATTSNAPILRPAEFTRVSRRPPPLPVPELSPNPYDDAGPYTNGDMHGASSSSDGATRNGTHSSQSDPPRTQPPSNSQPDTPRVPARGPSLARRYTARQSKSLPVPTRQRGQSRGGTEPPPLPEPNGRRILFYVSALYDYTATTEQEFDFQTGDVIAVTATPDDGWWSGELLDEARREEGRHVFPSNFVCLF